MFWTKHTPTKKTCQSSEYLPLSQVLVEFSGQAPAAPAAGVCASAFGGSTPITYPPQVANFGIDTVEIGFHIAFNNRYEIFSALAEQKAWLQSGNDTEQHFKFLYSNLFSFNLQRTGTARFQYRLVTGDITLQIAKRTHTCSAPNAYLKIGSVSCQEGLEETVAKFKRWILYLGWDIFQEKVSRVDFAADVKEHIENTGIEDYHRHVCRSRFCNPHIDDRRLSGITIGRGDIVLRVYDKIREMETKQAHEKQSFFRHLWGGEQAAITRVEYQLRRTPVKEIFGEDSRLSVVLKNKGKVWEYLTKDWFRHSESKVDRVNKHQSRSEVSSFWEIVQLAASYAGFPSKRTKKYLHIDIPSLKKMVRGCLLSIAAGVGHQVDDFFGIMATCKDLIEEEVLGFYENAEYKKRFSSKQAAAFVTF